MLFRSKESHFSHLQLQVVSHSAAKPVTQREQKKNHVTEMLA